MSFFANLVAGMGAGLGKGMVAEADYQDKLDAQRALLAERQANALELQRQRAEERALFASSKGGGSDGGGDLFGMLRSAKTPEEQRQVLGYIKSFAGPEAAMLLEENVFGRIPMQDRQYETIDALGDGTSGGRTSVSERVAYDRDQGQKALGRVYALIANKGQTKSHAEGEAQYFTNDMRATAVEQERKRGKSLVEAAETGARVADPAGYAKNQTNADRVAVTAENVDLKRDLAALKREADAALKSQKNATDIEDLILKNKRFLAEFGDRDGSVAATIKRLQAGLNAAPAAPPAPKSVISGNGKVATGKIGSWRDKAAAAGY